MGVCGYVAPVALEEERFNGRARVVVTLALRIASIAIL